MFSDCTLQSWQFGEQQGLLVAEHQHAGCRKLAASLHARRRCLAHLLYIVCTSGTLYDNVGTSGTLYDSVGTSGMSYTPCELCFGKLHPPWMHIWRSLYIQDHPFPQRVSSYSLVGSSESSSSPDIKFFKPRPVASVTSLRTRMAATAKSSWNALSSLLPAMRSSTAAQYMLDSDSGSRCEVELGSEAEHHAPQRLVHASIIDPNEVQICKQAGGDDWLLGMGSYGMVSPPNPLLFYFCLFFILNNLLSSFFVILYCPGQHRHSACLCRCM